MSLEIVPPAADGKFTILKFSGRLDASQVDEYKQKISQIIQGGAVHYVGDFAELKYISSAGLNLLIHVHREVSKKGGEFRIAAVQQYVKEIFDLTGYTKIFKLYESVAQAGA